MHTQLYAAYQLRYGDRGLSSNIAVPSVVMHSNSTQKAMESREHTMIMFGGKGMVLQFFFPGLYRKAG
eukprot:g12000.t1